MPPSLFLWLRFTLLKEETDTLQGLLAADYCMHAFL